MSLATDFYRDLCANCVSKDSASYWPQIHDIMNSAMVSEHADQSVIFRRHLDLWLYKNPKQPWSPHTEEVFACMLAKNQAAQKITGLGELLRAWTKVGTYMPLPQYSPNIGVFLTGCDIATAARLLMLAPNASALLPTDTQKEWTDICWAYTSVDVTRADTPQAVFAYLNGRHSSFTPEQERMANDALIGLHALRAIPFPWAQDMAKKHPRPEQLQAAFLRSALRLEAQPKQFGSAKDLVQNACNWVLADWLNRGLPDQPMLRAEFLLMGALLEREAPGWIDPTVWQRQVPDEWALAVSTLPVLESLTGIVWDPDDPEATLLGLTPLLTAFMAPQALDLILPAEWSANV